MGPYNRSDGWSTSCGNCLFVFPWSLSTRHDDAVLLLLVIAVAVALVVAVAAYVVIVVAVVATEDEVPHPIINNRNR